MQFSFSLSLKKRGEKPDFLFVLVPILNILFKPPTFIPHYQVFNSNPLLLEYFILH